jgi:hypothetical protein
VAVAVAGCLPEAAPPWQVERTIAAAMRVEVVRRGPWGAESPRDDRTVATVMPGDEVRVTPFFASPDGPVAPEALRPAWFYCRGGDCFDDLGPAGVRPCGPAEPVPPTSTCELPRGPAAALTLGPLTSLLLLQLAYPSVMMVAGTPEGPSSAECRARLQRLAEDGESLADCVLVVHALEFGPAWRLLALAAWEGLPDAVPLAGITPAVTATPPNLYPGAPALAVTIAGPDGVRELQAASGDEVAVRPDELVEISARVDPDDAQDYYFLASSGAAFVPATEALTVSWLFSDAVSHELPALLSARFVAPARPGPLWVYALVGDGRAVTPAWLRFEVERP